MIRVAVVDEIGALVQIVGRIVRPGCWNVDDGRADHCPHMQVDSGFGNDLGKEILVAETGDARPEHFSNRQFRAIADKFRACKATLNRPDPLLKPGNKRQVVCKPPKKRHCGMHMGIDQARNHHMAWTLDKHARLVRLTRFIERQNCRNPIVDHRHGVVLEYRSGRFDRDAPMRCNQGIAMSHIALVESVSGAAGR